MGMGQPRCGGSARRLMTIARFHSHRAPRGCAPAVTDVRQARPESVSATRGEHAMSVTTPTGAVRHSDGSGYNQQSDVGARTMFCRADASPSPADVLSGVGVYTVRQGSSDHRVSAAPPIGYQSNDPAAGCCPSWPRRSASACSASSSSGGMSRAACFAASRSCALLTPARA